MQTQINLVVVGQSQQYHAMLKAGMWYTEKSQGGQILCQVAFDVSCWCDFTIYFLWKSVSYVLQLSILVLLTDNYRKF